LRGIITNCTENSFEIPQENLILYFYALASAIEYLHNKGIVHRDIKPENILIDSNGLARLSDVGGATLIDEDSTINSRVEGTVLYSAPEFFNGGLKNLTKKNFYKSDIWSLGVVMIELMTTKRINASNTDLQIKKKLAALNEKHDKTLIELLGKMLVHDPNQRKSASEVKLTLEVHYGDLVDGYNRGETSIENLLERRPTETFFKRLTNSIIKPMEGSLFKEGILDDGWKSKGDMKKTKRIDDKWAKYFSVDIEGFHVEAAKTSIKDVTLKDFMMDMDLRLRENRTQKIRYFALDLKNCEKITDEGATNIFSSFRSNFRSLQRLSVNFNGCKFIGDEGLKAIGAHIGANLQELTFLELDFNNCKTITNQGVKDLTLPICSNQKKLNTLGLHFYGCLGITDPAVHDFMTLVGANLQNLKKFALTLSYCEQITDQSIRDISVTLGKYVSGLHYLELNFVSCKLISDQGFEDLGIRLISNLKYLTHLDLNFGVWDKQCDQKVKDVAAHIEANFKNLPHLGLNLLDSKKVTDQGMICLIENIGNHAQKLEYLGINLSYFSRITDEGVYCLADHLGNLRSLKGIDLNFSNCKFISDDCVENLLYTIGTSLPELRHLGINLWNCKQLTDQSIRGLIVSTRKLVNLRVLDLDFDCLSSISENVIQDLSSSIRLNLKNLQLLRLNLWNCPQINKDLKELLKVLFQYVPKSQIRF